MFNSLASLFRPSALAPNAGAASADSFLMPPEHCLVGSIPEEGLGQSFVVGDHYLKLRLAEMRLIGRNSPIQSRMPACVSVLDCFYAGEKRSLPAVASFKRLEQVLSDTGVSIGPVEIHGRPLTGLIPILSDEIGLFTGLVSYVYSDSLRICLDLLSEVSTTAGLVPFTAGMPLAYKTYETLKSLFGIRDFEYHFGVERGFKVKGNKPGRQPETISAIHLRGGYLVIAGREIGSEERQRLRVVDGRLWQRAEGGPLDSRPDFDFCLIKIEQVDQRPTCVDLPFHQDWIKLQRRVIAEDAGDLRSDWRNLVLGIRTSVDLIEEDKMEAVAAYSKLLRDEQDLTKAASGPTDEATRGGTVGLYGVKLLNEALERPPNKARRGAVPSSRSETAADASKRSADPDCLAIAANRALKQVRDEFPRGRRRRLSLEAVVELALAI